MTRSELLEKINKLMSKIEIMLILENDAYEARLFDIGNLWTDKIYFSQMKLIELKFRLHGLL
mgnify:CR=1 FL=1